MANSWKSFHCPQQLLNLDIVLACGQCFRWIKTNEHWTGVAGHRIWFLKQDDEKIFYKSFAKDEEMRTAKSERLELETEGQGGVSQHLKNGLLQNAPAQLPDNEDEDLFLKDYFQLNVDLESLYKQWSKNDQLFNKLSSNFGGLRMLRQDPVENLFSFICSQNNHISRISSMVEKLCVNYGNLIGTIEGKEFYSFPTISALSQNDVDGKLRQLGFGYRAKFINQCAKKILDEHDEDWLEHLRTVPYKEAHIALCQLPGVGAKVADCVCLMSLDKTEATPVDTHVWQVAQRDYLPHLKKYKTLTDKIYKEIGDHFRGIYGDYAGWAQSVS
eukprot:Seg8715.1 transcript_id=Seg8715.1/GoldUCD/mRNA.D3Y31 product="N-glycosylase/DNA lyase" protein_id=Seg8715.1/GoldUCD/D3Y31